VTWPRWRRGQQASGRYGASAASGGVAPRHPGGAADRVSAATCGEHCADPTETHAAAADRDWRVGRVQECLESAAQLPEINTETKEKVLPDVNQNG